MSKDLKRRLFPMLPDIVKRFGTPFHLYDAAGIKGTVNAMHSAFDGLDYWNYYAVKANPNPAVLRLTGFSDPCFDCSSIPELVLAREYVGVTGEQIMFTSNNTSEEEFAAALGDGGCILNLDDISLIDKVPRKNFPELICFRYNPGKRRTGNSIIGNPYEAKYGIMHSELIAAYREAKRRGATRFGLHTMVCSNELRITYMIETVRMLLDIAVMLKDRLGIQLEFINMGGGFGTPYRPSESDINIKLMASRIRNMMLRFRREHGFLPRLLSESGRYVTGPHGVYVNTVINQKFTYQRHVGVDGAMSGLPRHAVYGKGAYHHVDVLTPQGFPRTGDRQRMNVVGPICENCDRLATQRLLPTTVREGDIIVTHNSAAHCYPMTGWYNGRIRPQELMLWADNTVAQIRRAETLDDYFATIAHHRLAHPPHTR